ncbi:PLP-dependent aminotransferase family protein [Oceanidesulfovibrio indonesiensis]|uniref:aminotransferase-like domain-containing protein n=1 Tax=Oceanidesulfovibrio indonesiensis TaxID=54767 RepID=UPI001F3D1FCC|nr:PLP-dependent aminotransferase family protein [Oceanidesulfovibrio indonesiensis]
MRPVYRALADAIERDVFSGALQPGMRLPTHRDLADAMGINVTTVTRGYAEAERRGLLSGTVGRGTFIAADAATPSSLVSFEPHSPGLIEMGLVTPLARQDPDLSESLRRLSRRRDPGAYLRYTDPRGLPQHREAGAQLARLYGVPAVAEEILVCSGSQHALTCCFMGLFSPGDRVATCPLTYPGLKSLAAMFGIRLCAVAMDEEGMLPEALDAACRRLGLKGLYLMPHMHNPTTASMSEKRRAAIAETAGRRGLRIVEDDAYALYSQTILSPVSALAPERSVFIAGTSKIMGGGMRVAFMSAGRGHRDELARAILNSMWMTPSLNAEIVSDWITSGRTEDIMQKRRQELTARHGLALRVLHGERLVRQEASPYVWWELPAPWTGQSLERAARQAGVNIFGAEKFAVGESTVPRCARVSLTGAAERTELEKGLALLRKIVVRTP